MKNIFFIACLITLISCDRVTTEYSTFEEASADKFFDKGWIPIELVDKSITNIYLQNDIDVNTFIFCFETAEPPKFIDGEHELQTSEVQLHRIDIPNWWNSEIIGNPRSYIKTENGDTINIVFNSDLQKIYGWGKYGR